MTVHRVETIPLADTPFSPWNTAEGWNPNHPSAPHDRTLIAEDTPRDRLTARLHQGEPAAFTQLYETMADRMFGFAYRMLRDRGAAEDAVQHSFLEFVRARPDLASVRSVEAWLFKSLRFTCLDELRRRSRRPESPSDELPELVSLDIVVHADPELEKALAELTPEQQEVLHLKHVEGYDGAAIAAIVGSNRTAVYAMASRAEARLKKLLEAVESHGDSTSSPVKGS